MQIAEFARNARALRKAMIHAALSLAEFADAYRTAQNIELARLKAARALAQQTALAEVDALRREVIRERNNQGLVG